MSIRPLQSTKRVPFELEVGKEYYVSFGSAKVRKCTLLEERESSILITIENGDRHTLFKDEIGRTEDEAIQNSVTS